MLKDMFKRKELTCVICQKKIEYEEEPSCFCKVIEREKYISWPV